MPQRLNPSFRRRLLPLLVACLVAGLALVGIINIHNKNLEKSRLQSQLAALTRLTALSERLSSEILGTIKYSDFFSLLISSQPHIEQEKLENYANLAIRQSPYIAGIQFAPNGWYQGLLSPHDINGFYYALIVLLGVLSYLSIANYQEKLEKSQRDPLTGTLNKTALKTRVNRLIRSRQPFALILIDLNEFKIINDTYGHYVGDQVLMTISHRLWKLLGKKNTLSRFGGDEYLLYTTLQGAPLKQLYEAILAEFTQPLIIEGHTISIDIAVGYACYPADGTDYDSLYQQADKYMYAHKRTQPTPRARLIG